MMLVTSLFTAFDITAFVHHGVFVLISIFLILFILSITFSGASFILCPSPVPGKSNGFETQALQMAGCPGQAHPLLVRPRGLGGSKALPRESDLSYNHT